MTSTTSPDRTWDDLGTPSAALEVQRAVDERARLRRTVDHYRNLLAEVLQSQDGEDQDGYLHA